MKINFLNNVLNVNAFAIHADSYIYTDVKDNLFYESKLIKKDIDGASLFFIKNNLAIIYDKVKGFYYLHNKELLYKNFIIDFYSNQLLLAQSNPIRVSRGLYKSTILEVDDNSMKIKNTVKDDFFGRLIYNTKSYYITFENNQIHYYSLLKSTQIWQYKVEKLDDTLTMYNEKKSIEVKQFIGAFNNLIWIYLSSEEIIGIDLKTGNQKHLLKGAPRENLVGNIEEYLEEKETIRFLDTKYTLDENTGIIHGIIYDKYYQINLNKETPLAEVFGMKTKFQEKNIDPGSIDRRFELKNDKLYFAAYEQGCFGILNTKTKKIEYFSERFTEHRIKEIQVSENEVYVLDQNNTLHIFEKETSQLS